MKFYLFLVGWGLVWLPPMFVAYQRGASKIIYFWAMMFAILVGLALLWSIPSI
jgi:hypothetical protein